MTLIHRKNILEIILLETVCKQYNVPLYKSYNYVIDEETSCDVRMSKHTSKNFSIILSNAKMRPVELISMPDFINIYQCSIIDAIKIIKNR